MNYSTIFISIKLGITTLIPGTITVVSATRKVNRLNRVYVNITVDVPIENQPQIIASGTGCTYDNNGNLTSDPSRGILDIEWSETGKPLRVFFVSGEEICYRYAATGEKLSEVFVDTDGRILRRRDIYGSYELTDGSLDRTQVGGGYLDSRGVFHVYVTDYQGNVIGIVNAKTGTPVQFTDYYPYGIPHATAYSPEANRRKFGGKEYTSEFGFSSCDFGARLYSPLLCVFDSPDPKASTYTHISPYTYCAADPVNFIDPTGEDVAVLLQHDGLAKQHMAMLIQKPNGKWSYYSVNGNNVYVSGKFWGGRKQNDVGIGSWESPQEFLNSDYNRSQTDNDSYDDVCDYNFTRCYIIKTTPEQDKNMIEDFKQTSSTEYNVIYNNFATAVQKVLFNSGIDVAKPSYKTTLTSDYYMLNGQPIYEYSIPNFTMLPAKAFKSIMKLNPKGKFIYKHV